MLAAAKLVADRGDQPYSLYRTQPMATTIWPQAAYVAPEAMYTTDAQVNPSPTMNRRQYRLCEELFTALANVVRTRRDANLALALPVWQAEVQAWLCNTFPIVCASARLCCSLCRLHRCTMSATPKAETAFDISLHWNVFQAKASAAALSGYWRKNILSGTKTAIACEDMH